MQFDELSVLLILVGLSVLGPLLAVRLHLPTPVVFILCGIAVGPAGLGWVRLTPTVLFVSRFGFLLLMFIAGMEIDFTALRAAGRRALLRPLLTVAGFFLIAVVAGILLELSVIEVLVVSACSVGMPLAMLQETGQTRKPLGRAVMLTASIGEFITILCVITYEMSVRSGPGLELAVELCKVLGLFAGSAVLIRWSRAVVWWYPEPFGRMVEHQDVAEMGVRVGLLLLLGFVTLAALLGIEAILGAFIAGTLVSFVLREKKVLEEKIAALGQGLFIPVFFVVVGIRFDLGSLDALAFRDATLLIAACAAVKLLPALLFGSPELPFLQRLGVATLLSSPLTLVVAIGTIGERLGVISSHQAATIVLMALGLSLIFPTLFKLIVGMSERAQRAPAPPSAEPSRT
jgi:Kef-type K+ transport system membrane component KefB